MIKGYEIKTGNSRYTAAQQAKDAWITQNRKIPIELIRMP